MRDVVDDKVTGVRRDTAGAPLVMESAADAQFSLRVLSELVTKYRKAVSVPTQQKNENLI